MMKFLRKTPGIRLSILILIIGWAMTAGAITTRVRVTQGGDPQFMELVSLRLTAIANCLESKTWDSIAVYCMEGGLESLNDLAQKTSWRVAFPKYDDLQLLRLPNNGWEVRDIAVRVKMRGTRGDDTQELVFTLTEQGLVSSVRFAIENEIYKPLMEQGKLLKDFAYRQPIVSFLETFRTAYNRKDLDFLKKVYSDDALIIVGRVLQTRPEDTSDLNLNKSTLSREKIEFIKESKQVYLEKLDRIFNGNAFVKIGFDSIDIKSSPDNPDVYGVMLKQEWRSSTYSDSGFLFLMLDFQDLNNPIIHVRSWQPKKFNDGSVVSLGDFIIPARSRK